MNEIISRRGKSTYIKSVRPMTKDDIELLRAPAARVRLANLRDIHHIIARLLASGLSLREVAAETGYTMARISIIRQAPAMADLIAKYRGDDTTEWRKSRDQFYEDVHSAGRKAWRQINDVLDESIDKAEPLPINRLLAIADSSSDRVGYHKKSATLNVNIDFAAKLEAAIARSNTVRVIDHDPD